MRYPRLWTRAKGALKTGITADLAYLISSITPTVGRCHSEDGPFSGTVIPRSESFPSPMPKLIAGAWAGLRQKRHLNEMP